MNRVQDLPEPVVSGGPLSPNRLPPQNDERRGSETAPLFLDPASGAPRVAYMVPDELLARCAQYGHAEKTKFGTWSEFMIIPLFRCHQLTRLRYIRSGCVFPLGAIVFDGISRCLL